MKSPPKTSPEAELVKTFEAAGVIEYLEYIQSGKRMLWLNFASGVAKGLGLTIGMTVVLGFFVWIMTMLVDLPLVGEYFQEAGDYVTAYAEKTNYTDEFERMTALLDEINQNLNNRQQ